MRYGITGATGFIGNALARRLLADGHEVVVTVRNPVRAADLAELGANVVAADLGDVPGMTAAFTGCDAVFHVAGWYKVGHPDADEGWRVNVEGTANVLESATTAGVPRVVYTSTCAVNSDTRGRTVDEAYRFRGQHLTTYDETKAAAHDLVVAFAERNDSPEIVIVMPGGVYGPGDTSQIGAMLADVAAGRRVMVSSSLRMVQAHVDDIVTGHVLALERGRPGEEYMLAGERTDLRAMATEMAHLTGGRTPVDMPRPVLSAAERVMGLVGRFAPVPAEFSAEALRSSQCTYLGTSSKAQRELGWTYRGLHQGLLDTAAAEGWLPAGSAAGTGTV